MNQLFEAGEMRMSATLSECKKYRWTLERSWVDRPVRTACWIMLNPSTADHRVNDPTILRVIHFTKLWGYDGFTVVNLFPFRSSSPKECQEHFAGSWSGPDWDIRDIRDHNLTIIQSAVIKSEIVVSAWGNIGWLQGEYWAEYVRDDVQCFSEGRKLFCLGKTQSGMPKHPLARGVHRVPNDQQPSLF